MAVMEAGSMFRPAYAGDPLHTTDEHRRAPGQVGFGFALHCDCFDLVANRRRLDRLAVQESSGGNVGIQVLSGLSAHGGNGYQASRGAASHTDRFRFFDDEPTDRCQNKVTCTVDLWPTVP